MGGGDVPASGFALYIDQLMRLAKIKDKAKPSGQTALINVGSDTTLLKEAFNLAGRLHEIGYPAELNLGGRQTAKPGWTIDVQGKKFLLTERTNKQKFEVQTVEEVIKLLRDKGE